LPCGFTRFEKFINRTVISPTEITEDLCKQFRQYLLDQLTGETLQNYFTRFIENPTEGISAKANPQIAFKEIVEVEDDYAFLATPCCNEELSHAFIFCLYTGLFLGNARI